jgi:uncharacterized protein (TIGR02996 family)
MPAKTKQAFPSPAAVLPGEAYILANVIGNLADHDAKLVYADWLEEHDDPRGPVLRGFVTAYRAGQKLPPVKSASQPWRDLVGITLVAQTRDTALAANADQLLALARPSIAYESAKAAENSLPVGASKLGGRPDLPPGIKWPKFRPRSDAQPLAFLGQFNLAELQASPVAREVPPSGVISVFCRYTGDGDDDFPRGTWRLFFFPDPAKLVRRELDEELPEGARFPSCRLKYTEILTLPATDSPWSRELVEMFIDTSWGSPYSELQLELCPGDHILGHPDPCQGDILGTKAVRHLLTICGDQHTGWEWGDGGKLYFILPEDDLKHGRFDAVEMQMDCG